MKETQPLTRPDIAALAKAAGIPLSGERLATVTDLANRFRDSVEVLRDYLAKQDGNVDKADRR